MTEKQVPGQLTREEAKNYILLTLDRFRVMTLHLNDNRSKLPSILNENKEILYLVYELEARNFYIDLMHLYLSDIFEVLSSEGYKEFLLKCKSISEKFCLKVKIPENITVVGEDIIEQFISELTEKSLKRIRNNLQEVEETRNLLLSQVQDVNINKINKNELEIIISKRQEYEIAKKNHNQANLQIQILASSHCTDENAYKPYYKICEENKKIMDTILCDYPLVQYFKNKTEEAYLKRQITKTFDDINDAINKIINKIIEGKYPIWHFDSLISELLQKYSSNEAQIIKQQLEDMKKEEDFKDLFLTIGSITLSVLTLLIPGGVIAGLLHVKSGLQIANAAFSVASAINDIEDSVLYRQEVLSHIKVSPEVQELMDTENISLTDAQIQLLVALLSSTFVIFDLSDAKKSVDLLRKLDNLDNEAVQALKQSKRFGEKAFLELNVEQLNALDDYFLTFFDNNSDNIVKMYQKLPTELVCKSPDDLIIKYTKTFEKFDDFAADVGKNFTGTVDEKVRIIQNSFENLSSGDRHLLTIPDDAIYVTGFTKDGYVKYLWPDNLGIKPGSDAAVISAKGNVDLPDELYRVGSYRGNNFSDAVYTYNELAIPYKYNDEALTVFKIRKDSYIKKIDAIVSGDINELNKILKSEGIAEIDKIDFKDIKESYFDFQNAVKKEKKITCNTKYGIKGIVAEWYNPNDKTVKWFNGGAPQFITPLNVRDMKILGIITEIE